MSRLRVRWRWALAITIAITALGSGWRARQQRTFQSTIVMRVTEGDFDPTTSPPTSSQLQQHLFEVALSRRTLFQLIHDHELYRDQYRLDPNLALDTMREDIELEVVNNYFSRQRFREDPPRSARIAISYLGKDPEKALAVVRDIGRKIEAEQQKGRRDHALDAAKSTAEAQALLRARVLDATRREAALKLDLPRLAGEQRASALLELARLAPRVRELERDIQLHAGRTSEYMLRSQFEGEAMGLRFEMVDSGKQAQVLLTNQERLVLFALLAFIAVFPIAAIGVGTFDSRVRDVYSLKRMGLVAFGHVPSFQGMDQGALANRPAAALSINSRSQNA